jgi:hypothetical protein
MKKMVTRSMVFALGASIFLFSEHVFGNTVIYDPLDPQNTITPITEQEVSSETSESAKIDGQIELEETETTSAQTTLETKKYFGKRTRGDTPRESRSPACSDT